MLECTTEALENFILLNENLANLISELNLIPLVLTLGFGFFLFLSVIKIFTKR